MHGLCMCTDCINIFRCYLAETEIMGKISSFDFMLRFFPSKVPYPFLLLLAVYDLATKHTRAETYRKEEKIFFLIFRRPWVYCLGGIQDQRKTLGNLLIFYYRHFI